VGNRRGGDRGSRDGDGNDLGLEMNLIGWKDGIPEWGSPYWVISRTNLLNSLNYPYGPWKDSGSEEFPMHSRSLPWRFGKLSPDKPDSRGVCPCQIPCSARVSPRSIPKQGLSAESSNFVHT
jgi:hypothetical protein